MTKSPRLLFYNDDAQIRYERTGSVSPLFTYHDDNYPYRKIFMMLF